MDEDVSAALKYVPMTYADAVALKKEDRHDSLITNSVTASSLLALATASIVGQKDKMLSNQLLFGGAGMGAAYHLARILGASSNKSLVAGIAAGALGTAAPVVVDIKNKSRK